MSDINLIVLSGRLVADAEFTTREGFLSVKMRIATNHRVPKKDTPPEQHTVYHNIKTTLDEERQGLVAAWKERCLKGARISLQGILDTDVSENPDGTKRYHAFVRARVHDVVLPDAPAANTSQQHASATRSASREIPAKLANRGDALHF